MEPTVTARWTAQQPHDAPKQVLQSGSKALPTMSTSYRRYEILLPRRYNDGRRVPARLVTETIDVL